MIIGYLLNGNLSLRSIFLKQTWFRSVLSFILILNLGICQFALNMYSSEISVREAKVYRMKKDWNRVIQTLSKVDKYFSIDKTSLPIPWLEGVAYFSKGNYALRK